MAVVEIPNGHGGGLRITVGMAAALLCIALNVGAIVWGAATLAERLNTLQASMIKVELKIDAMNTTLQSHDVRMTRLEAIHPAIARP